MVGRTVVWIVWLICLLLLNRPYRYHEVSVSLVGNSSKGLHGVGPYQGADAFNMSMAGWPFTGYVRAEFGTLEPIHRFDVLGIGLGVLFWWITAAVVFRYFGFPLRRLQEDKPPNPRKLKLADVLLFMTLIGGGVAFVRYLNDRTDEFVQLADEIRENGGEARLMAFLPPWAIGGFQPYLRLKDVRLKDPSTELVDKVARLPCIRGIHLEGSGYDLRALEPILDRPWLTDLSIMSRDIREDEMAILNQMKSLQSLNLTGSVIQGTGLANLNDLPRLRRLILTQTTADLGVLGTDGLRSRLMCLYLSAPVSKAEAGILLDGWSELRELRVLSAHGRASEEEVLLALHHLPRLQQLELDPFQSFELDLRELPALSDIQVSSQIREKALQEGLAVPSAPWVSSFRLQGLASLEQLKLYTRDLREFEMDPQASLEVILSTMEEQVRQDDPTMLSHGPFNRSLVTEVKPDVPPGVRQNWIEALARHDGPVNLDLQEVPLTGVDLSSLRNNESLRQLSVGRSGLDGPKFLEQLRGMDGLSRLVVEGKGLQDCYVEQVLEAFPNLTVLKCEALRTDRLRLVDHPLLEQLVIGSLRLTRNATWEVRQLDLVNLPNLSGEFYFQVSEPEASMTLQGLPKVTGLTFYPELPKLSEFSGVKDLRAFDAGGPHCTDEVVQEVLKCRGLKRLALKNVNLRTAESLSGLEHLRELEFLVLSGRGADGALLDFVQELPAKLTTLTLGIANPSEETLDKVGRLKGLTSLDFAGAELTTEQVREVIRTHPQLVHLGLTGCALSPEICLEMKSLKALKMLDLSGCELTDEITDSLVQSLDNRTLSMLKIGGASISSESEQRLGSAFSKVWTAGAGVVTTRIQSRFDARTGIVSPIGPQRSPIGRSGLSSGATQPSSASGERVLPPAPGLSAPGEKK